MSRPLPLLEARLFGRPLLVMPETATAVARFLQGRAVGGPSPEANEITTRRRDAAGDFTLSPRVENGAVAVIPILGELVNRGAWLDASSGLVSYDGIEAQLDEAEADPAVRLIAFDLDSPGGEVGGLMSLMDRIRSATTPTVAVVNDLAASAAYGIASACDQIVISPTGRVGSIGVVLMHVDASKAMADDGLNVTLIHAGAHKVDGNPFEPLPDAVRARLQAEIDSTYALFTDAISQGRGSRLSADQARSTEAQIYRGQDAIDAGLADQIGTLTTAISANPAATAAQQRRATMADDPQTAPNAGAIEAAIANGRQEGVAQGRADERARIAAILNSDAAKTRPRFAARLAFETDRPADEAVADLNAAGAELQPPASDDDPKISQRQDAATGFGDAPGSSASNADARRARRMKAAQSVNVGQVKTRR